MSVGADMIAGIRGAWQNLFGSSGSDLIPQTRLAGPMPWVIAIMVALTLIAVAAGLALRNAADAARAELHGGITVQIVEARADRRDLETEAAIEKLRALDEVRSIQPVPGEDVAALIEPWLGSGSQTGVAAEIPVPTLIDVRIAGEVTPQRLASIRQELASVAPSVRVDAQSRWLRPVFEAIQSLQWLALALVVLLALALSAAVLLAARTALGTSRSTIEIIHLLGGTDTQIARIFQRSIGVDAAGGGLVGLLLAVVVILFLGRRFAELGAGLVDSGSLGLTDWIILASVPLIAVALAMVTARLTVMNSLSKML